MFFDISFLFVDLGWSEPERRAFPSYDAARHYAEAEKETSTKPRFPGDVLVPIAHFAIEPVNRLSVHTWNRHQAPHGDNRFYGSGR